MSNKSYDDFIGAMEEDKQRKSERKRAEQEAAAGAPQFECPECQVFYAITFGMFVQPIHVEGGPRYLCKNCYDFLRNDFREVNLGL